MITKKPVEDLAFLYFKRKLNSSAFEKKIISVHMYQYAKEKIEKQIDSLEKICYTTS